MIKRAVSSNDRPESRRSKSEIKAEITNTTARAILKAEAEHCQAKIARLRKARLAEEARQTKLAPVKHTTRKTPKV